MTLGALIGFPIGVLLVAAYLWFSRKPEPADPHDAPWGDA